MRKNLITLSVLVFLIMIISPITSLGEGANYQSKSTISFKKGSTELEEETVIPGGKEAVLESKDKTSHPGTKSDSAKGKKLPKTATNNYNLLVLGIFLVVSGAILYSIRESKKENYINDLELKKEMS